MAYYLESAQEGVAVGDAPGARQRSILVARCGSMDLHVAPRPAEAQQPGGERKINGRKTLYEVFACLRDRFRATPSVLAHRFRFNARIGV